MRSCILIPRAAAVAALLWLVATTALGTDSPKFYDDDPLWREPETQDASTAEEREIDLIFDLMRHLFAPPGRNAARVRAQNINTADEVPDSSWFENRILARPFSLDELVRGPNTLDTAAFEERRATTFPLTVIRPKTVGAAPGVVVRGSAGETWFLSFDPPGNPEAATGAMMVASKIFWALGYWQTEYYLANVRVEDFVIGETAQIKVPSGERRKMTLDDLKAVLRRAARNPDGSYRVIGSRLIAGKTLGGFQYHGTRPDDPNDVVPHEHRRELRALKVFGAWTNLVDLKAGNTLDALVTQNGRSVVRHYLQDVGSTFGIGANGPHDWDEGFEHLYEGDPTWKRALSLGFYLRPWQTLDYPSLPQVGRFEGDAFDPEEWRSRVPAGALLHARDDDTFWAARRVMSFTDEMIRAVVKEARFSDPAAERYLGDVLIKRRDKIGHVYLTKINPLVDFALDASGVLTFENAAVQAKVADPPKGGYSVTWALFDNHTGRSQPLGAEARALVGRFPGPPGLPTSPGSFIKLEISAVQPPLRSWTIPVTVYFKRTGEGWNLVGLERL